VRPRFRAGLALSSRPLGAEGISIHANRARVTRPARAGGDPVCGPAQPQPCVLAEMTYGLPDTLLGGVTVHASPLWDLDLIGRWLNFSRHETARIRLGGPVAGGLHPDLPEHVVLHRGFTDVFDVRARATRRLGERVAVSATARAETSAVPAAHVSPAAVDSFKLEPSVAVRVRLGAFQLAAGYAFTYFLPVDPGGGAFDPGAVAACDEARGALEDPACAKRNAGLARPAALGRYTQQAHTVSLAVGARL
jgi:hypothetical protein